jgi:hypothetical protein
MHLFLDLVRPKGECVVYSGECQPRLRKGGHFGSIVWADGSFRNLEKDQGTFAAVFHGFPVTPIQRP